MKLKFLIFVLFVSVAVGVGFMVMRRSSGPSVTVTLRVAVSPESQSNMVVGYANSARFKYLMARDANVKTVLAQKLAIKPLPAGAQFEANVRLETKADGERYAEAFVGTLQEVCGKDAQLTLVSHSIR